MIDCKLYKEWITCKQKKDGSFYEISYASNCVSSLNTLFGRLDIVEFHGKKSPWEFDSLDDICTFIDEVCSTERFIELDAYKSSNHRYKNALKFLYLYMEDVWECSDKALCTIVNPIKEGERKICYSTYYERKPACRRKAIELHGTVCCVCGFDFKRFYGDIGKDYIEVHHIKPLYVDGEEIDVNPETDLICLCANCHRMIHRKRNEIISVEQLKNMISIYKHNIEE